LIFCSLKKSKVLSEVVVGNSSLLAQSLLRVLITFVLGWSMFLLSIRAEAAESGKVVVGVSGNKIQGVNFKG
jgi:hypothetical protein